jgi:hypothetical protein
MGHGPINVGDPVVFDIWPRDDASACFADMTRTFVVGSAPDAVLKWHTLTKQALDAATAVIRPGVDCREVFDVACDVYEAAGYATLRTKQEARSSITGSSTVSGTASGSRCTKARTWEGFRAVSSSRVTSSPSSLASTSRPSAASGWRISSSSLRTVARC